jgi:hypothetical protein
MRRRLAIGLAVTCLVSSAACEREPVTVAPPGSQTRMIIDVPADRTVGLHATFKWHLQNADPADTYRYELRFDKGENACDNSVEQSFPAESRTCLTIDLDSRIYGGQKVWFGIQAINGKGQAFCAEGKRLSISKSAPPAPGCDASAGRRRAAPSLAFFGRPDRWLIRPAS